jgi:hypothetical protein
MNPDHLKSLLAIGAAEDPPGTATCPDEHQIAGYVDAGLDEDERRQIEIHLADCGRCLALVGLLSRERDADASDGVPDMIEAGARARVATRPAPRWRPAPQWAAAAALVLAVPLLLQIGRNLERGAEGQGRPAPSAARNLAPTGAELQLLSPRAGAVVDARRPSFRWTEVAGTPYYDVRIVTEDGDLVVQERIDGTAWRPQLELRPGTEYFVHVDAYPSGDKAVSSEHVPFRVLD